MVLHTSERKSDGSILEEIIISISLDLRMIRNMKEQSERQKVTKGLLKISCKQLKTKRK